MQDFETHAKCTLMRSYSVPAGSYAALDAATRQNSIGRQNSVGSGGGGGGTPSGGSESDRVGGESRPHPTLDVTLKLGLFHFSVCMT